jgi:glyoxylase-like metal-dependent hydrolase (beta-lactamase superfamily II)
MSVEQFLEVMNLRFPASPAVALPVVTFTDAVTFHLNGEEIHAVHLPPAHTDGDSVVHFRKSNVIHTGDLYFNGGYPVIDIYNGGSLEGMIAAVQRVLDMAGPDTQIIPGHGPVARRTDLETYRDMLSTIRDRVTALKREGKTLEQALEAKPLADLDGTWGKGFVTSELLLRVLYATPASGAGRP